MEKSSRLCKGGCFKISSLGGIGGTAFTPIINAPEVAILGVSRSTHKPVYKDGGFVQPDDATFQAAAAFADWKGAPGFYQVLTEQPGKDSWPITGASFILLHAKADKPQTTAEVLKFFDWALKNGQAMAAELDYVPMPAPVVQLIADAWRRELKDASGKPLWH